MKILKIIMAVLVLTLFIGGTLAALITIIKIVIDGSIIENYQSFILCFATIAMASIGVYITIDDLLD